MAPKAIIPGIMPTRMITWIRSQSIFFFIVTPLSVKRLKEKSTGCPVLFPTIYEGELVLVLGLCELFAVLGALDTSDGEDHQTE